MSKARTFFSCCLLGVFAACSADDMPGGSGHSAGRGGSAGSSGAVGGSGGATAPKDGGSDADASPDGRDSGGTGGNGAGGTATGGAAGIGGGGSGGTAGTGIADSGTTGGASGKGGAAGAAGNGGTAGTAGAGGTGGTSGAGGTAGTAGRGGAAGGGGSADGGGTGGSGGGTTDGGPAGNPACGVTIDKVTAFTQSQVVLETGGTPIPASDTAKRGLAYVVVGHDSIFRVYATATNTSTDVTASVTLTSSGNAQQFSVTKKPVAKSSDAALDSTFNIAVPGSAIKADSTYSVTLTQAAPCTTPGEYRFPKSGEQTLEAHASGTLQIAVLITQFSGVPAAVFDDERKQMFIADFKRYYPHLDLQVRVIPGVYTWNFSPGTVGDQSGVYDGCGAYFNDKSKFPRSKEFLICVYRQQSAFPRGVSGGISYLTEEKDLRATDIGTDATAIIGYPTNMIPTDADYPNWMRITFVHELGHSMGLPHAPSGGAADPDPAFPYKTGAIGVWGWDPQLSILRDPKAPDLMGYQWDFPPKVSDALAVWLSDYYYGKVVRRINRVDTFKLLASGLAPQRYRTVVLQGGRARLTNSSFTSDELPRGRETSLSVRRKGALTTETLTGYFQPSSDPTVARVVFPDDGTVTSLWVDGSELIVR